MRNDAQDETLLIVEDDDAFRQRLAISMERRGLTVVAAPGVEAALEAIEATKPDFAIVDLRLEDGNGLTVVDALKQAAPDARALILTGYGDIPTTVAAVQNGAVDYIAKPATADEILDALYVAPSAAHAPPPDDTLSPDEARLEHIKDVFQKADGNVSKAARLLNMHRRTLQRVLKRKDIGRNAA